MTSKQRQAYAIAFKLQVIVLIDMGRGQLKGSMDHQSQNNLGMDEEGVGIKENWKTTTKTTFQAKSPDLEQVIN